MYEAIAAVLIAIITPFVSFLREHKTTATDAPPNPHRKRWLDRVRKFKSGLHK